VFATSSGVAGFAERNLRLNRFFNFIRQTGGHVGGDESGRDRVDRDVAARQFARERFRKTDQAGFAGGVIGLAGVTDQTNNRRDVENAAAALLDHRPQNRLGEIETRRANSY